MPIRPNLELYRTSLSVYSVLWKKSLSWNKYLQSWLFAGVVTVLQPVQSEFLVGQNSPNGNGLYLTNKYKIYQCIFLP